eukprot:TRINITY_DN546_c1_g2_i3.p7 TRINITY_DN546_c1_g2~~TRINITY_DN546_c1_g2_i3.p7  ORF type:complete len:114 (-),score=4.49 TRINITY_DN546_c1_g2_i3:1103-1444(-)
MRFCSAVFLVCIKLLVSKREQQTEVVERKLSLLQQVSLWFRRLSWSVDFYQQFETCRVVAVLCGVYLVYDDYQQWSQLTFYAILRSNFPSLLFLFLFLSFPLPFQIYLSVKTW